MIKFEYRQREYPIKLTYFDAINTFPERFNIDLCEIFTSEEKALMTMQLLALDDKLCLKLMHYFIGEEEMDWDDLLKNTTEKDINRFREDFWTAAGLFSGPLKKGIMDQMWRQFKKELKETDFAALISEASHSDSKAEGSTSDQKA